MPFETYYCTYFSLIFIHYTNSKNLNRDETKMTNAIQAADTFIKTYASTDSYVGIIDFDSGARVNSDLYQLSNEIDRFNLSSLLPVNSDAGGGTTIYAGVDKAIEVLF